MITNQERNELLADSGLTEKDLRVIFSEMGVDYDAPEFDDNLVEDVMKMAEDLGFAVKEVKRLAAANPTASPMSAELVTQQISEMMFSSLEAQGRSFPVEAILTLAQARAEEYIRLSDTINQLAKRAYQIREAHNECNFINEQISRATQSRDVVEELLSDEGQKEIIESLTPQTRLNGEVGAFRALLDSKRKANVQIEGKRFEQVKALPTQDLKQLRGAFLASMKG